MKITDVFPELLDMEETERITWLTQRNKEIRTSKPSPLIAPSRRPSLKKPKKLIIDEDL